MVVLRVAGWLAAVCVTSGSFGYSLLTGVVLRELADVCVVLSVRCMQLTSNQDGAVVWLKLIFPSCWAVMLRMIRMVMVMRTVGVVILTMIPLMLPGPLLSAGKSELTWGVPLFFVTLTIPAVVIGSLERLWQLLSTIVMTMLFFLSCWAVIVKVTSMVMLTMMLISLNYWTVTVKVTRMGMLTMFLFLHWLLHSR